MHRDDRFRCRPESATAPGVPPAMTGTAAATGARSGRRPSVRLSSLAGPTGVAVIALAGAVVLRARDPHLQGAYGFCPFHALTGWWCPGCGGLRAIHDLTVGDVAGSLSSNVYVLPMVLVLVVAWAGWVRRRWRGGVDAERPIVLSGPASTLVLISLAVFTVLRNTAWGAVLAPT